MRGARMFEIVQGGIGILILIFEDGKWHNYVVDDLHPTVKQDTDTFVTQELVELLIQAIVNYYDCFTERKIIRYKN